MKNTIRAVILIGSMVSTLTNVNAQKEETLLTIENEKISVDQFEKVYNKNNVNTSTVEQKSVEEYLDLYINFKLKVKEAEALGMDTVGAYKAELKGYVDQLSAPYLLDREYNEGLIKEAYDRLKFDVKASHILIKVDENAIPEDTLKAYQKIMDIKKSIDEGGDFTKKARELSDDPSAKQNNGELGYFSAFRMVYPFESAAFNTPVGQVSEPVRTRFGYHIIKVTDKRSAYGEMKAAHVMVSVKPDATEEEKENAKKKIFEIAGKIGAGEDFKTLAQKFSDDRGSARKGGELPWFGAGRMVPEFEKESFSLKNNNDVSEPFKTEFGWHIVKRLDKKELGTFEKEKDQLKKKVERDGRSKNSKASLVAKLKKAYKVKEYVKAKDAFLPLLDSSIYKAAWKLPNELSLKDKLFRLDDKLYGKQKKTYTQRDFADYILSHQRKISSKSLEQVLNQFYTEFLEESIISYEESILTKKYPEYKSLVQEYRDGILLFELMEQKVWKKAVRDTAGLEIFYEANKQNFMWNDRIDAKVFTCKDESIAKEVATMLSNNASDSLILATINQKSQLAVDIKEGKYSKGDSDVIDQISWKVGLTNPIQKNGSYYVVNVREILAAQPKKLDEAKGAITSAYQNELENNWIKELRTKYSYSVNKEAIKMVNK